ncbi:Flavin reductase [Acidipropionibacterium acidipropionici ATCC 4875]|uniref:Flavin reductase n=1 Tax=Acidipropionibacterium acidipropionici (strain ATCC 4875 / DSM 20272 / JCM 6432 / NBRC 12425 / NCIMB 8070 / 4) TaxID=1171373 RepID=K7RQZ4_ACIA4|nr:Flavin reductase [Acidipropionibacterium acidipropionici ATCC 4875]
MLTDRLVAGLVEAGVEAQIEVIEVRDHAHDLVNAELTGMRTTELSAVLDRVASSDALVVVTPVFNAHPAGLFQMFFEVLDEGALAGMPVLSAPPGAPPVTPWCSIRTCCRCSTTCTPWWPRSRCSPPPTTGAIPRGWTPGSGGR